MGPIERRFLPPEKHVPSTVAPVVGLTQAVNDLVARKSPELAHPGRVKTLLGLDGEIADGRTFVERLTGEKDPSREQLLPFADAMKKLLADRSSYVQTHAQTHFVDGLFQLIGAQAHREGVKSIDGYTLDLAVSIMRVWVKIEFSIDDLLTGLQAPPNEMRLFSGRTDEKLVAKAKTARDLLFF